MGDTTHAYVTSYDTLKMDFSLKAPDRDQPSDGRALAAWIRGKETDLKRALSPLNDEDLNTPVIDRGRDWVVPRMMQFHIYREALLIFFGKLDVYLRAAGKERPEIWRQWVG